MQSLENELNLDIFLSDNDIKKKEKKYSSTKVKARNFLTNVSYNGVKKIDYENRSFVIDIFAYLILYFNSYNVDGKFESEIEKDYINVLWTMLIPQNFYNFVCRDENIKILNKTNAKFQEAVEIVKLFIENANNDGITQEEQYGNLKEYLTKYVKMYQLIFGNLFPKYFSKIDNYGIEAKIEFNSYYRTYLNQKTLVNWERNNLYWEEAVAKNTPSLELNSNSEVSEELKKIEVIEIKEEPIDKKQIKKAKKREIKKRKLEEKLMENTEKIKKIKKNKNNK